MDSQSFGHGMKSLLALHTGWNVNCYIERKNKKVASNPSPPKKLKKKLFTLNL